MQSRKFQLHFSEEIYKSIYDESDRKWKTKKHNKEIYSLKQKGLKGKDFIAKKYIIKKDDYIDEVWKELNTIIKLRNHDHPNVIKYTDVFMFDVQENYTDYQVLLMVMEMGENTLEEFVEKQIELDIKHKENKQEEESTIKKNKLSFEQHSKNYQNLVYQYLKQTLDGCKFLKTKNIYHRDYKPMNLVLLNNKVKIIDFDIAKITQFDITQQMSGIKGTEIYMDPHLINIQSQEDCYGKDDPEIRYNLEKMDIYSIGCTFLKLAMRWNTRQYRKFWFDTNDYYHDKQYQEQEYYLQQITSSVEHKKLQYILGKMLLLDVKKRWNLDECIHEEQYSQSQKQISEQQQQQENNNNNNNNNNLEWLNNEQIEQLEGEKQTLILENYLQEVPQTRYLVIKQYQQMEYYGQKIIKIVEIVNNQSLLTKLVIDIEKTSQEFLNQLFPNININLNLKLLTIKIGSHNEIGENGVRSLQKGLEKLILLQQLHLEIGNNKIGENGATSLAKSLEKLIFLQQLNLIIWEDNKIGENGASSIAKALKKLTTLQKLHLQIESNNEIGQNGAIGIAKGLEKLIFLQQLHLIIGNNIIGEIGAVSLGKALEKLTLLQKFHLYIGWNNEIGQNGAVSLANALEKLIILEYLNLIIGSNLIGEIGAASLGRALQQLTQLQQLQLAIGQWNKIGEKGAVSIAKGLQNLILLQQLYLEIGDCNYIGENGAVWLGLGLEKLGLLEKLHLVIYPNEIGENGAASIAKGLEKLTCLQKLHFEILSRNEIGENGAASIAKGLEKLTNLQQIHLVIGLDNEVGEEGEKVLGFAVLMLPNISKLYLELNSKIYEDKLFFEQIF